MVKYENLTMGDIDSLAELYVDTFNAPPWNDKWTIETAQKRLTQMINTEEFYGLCAYQGDNLCGMILGSHEQFYDGIMFNIKEFCVSNHLRGKGIGTALLSEFEMRLKQQGIKEVILLTSRNDGTEGFYHKRGLQTYSNMVVMGKQL